MRPDMNRNEHHEPIIFSLIVRILCVATGAAAFHYFAQAFNRAYSPDKTPIFWTNTVGFMVAGALLGVLVSPYFMQWLLRVHRAVMNALRGFSPHILASGFLGLIVGLIFANLATLPLFLFLQAYRALGLVIAISCSVIFGYLGVLIFSRLAIFGAGTGAVTHQAGAALPKVLDSSVIIDGRVLELARHRFLEGKLVIPSVVLSELQAIADHTDPTRKKRGRLGLDVIKMLREIPSVNVEISDMEGVPRDASETVDTRILNFARSIGGVLVTNDFNLARVAEIRDVTVYNLNTLATDLRKTILPGEKIEVHVVKYGKESGQGIAYLDDGTMIVIESGDAFVGESVMVEIASMLQTVAGRLIFARPLRDGGQPGAQHNGKAK